MNSLFKINCRVAPAGKVGPLIPNLMAGDNILMLEVSTPHASPKGFNIAVLLNFDMQDDGGVNGIEILQPLGSGLISGSVDADPKEKYWRLFLEPSNQELVEQNADFVYKRDGHLAIFQVSEEAVEREYLIGPGVNALVGNGEFRGISLDLTGFMR